VHPFPVLDEGQAPLAKVIGVQPRVGHVRCGQLQGQAHVGDDAVGGLEGLGGVRDDFDDGLTRRDARPRQFLNQNQPGQHPHGRIAVRQPVRPEPGPGAQALQRGRYACRERVQGLRHRRFFAG
jgi:hypothetical protein